MKLAPLTFAKAIAIVSAVLLAGCGKPAGNTSTDPKNDQDRLAEEKQQQILSALHEREAALDERDRLLNERAKQLNVVPPTPQIALAGQSAQPAQPSVADQAPPQQDSNAPATPDVSYQQFYDALSPFGNWLQMPNYGYVWQPNATVQDHNWRPYTIGNFVYTDEGWTWVSDEPFGWATYHYGRWMRTQALGWVWTPGDIWAPAWVSWRYGNDYVGWAPLPPEATFNPATGIQQTADQQYSLGPDDYTFVPAAAFGDDNMAADLAPQADVASIYDDSANETNIYYDAASYVVICYGPNYDFIRTKARHGLRPPLKISRAGFAAHGNNGTVIAGNTLHVTAPRIFGTHVPPKPHLVRGTIADVRLVAPQPPLTLASRPQGQVAGPEPHQPFAQPANPPTAAAGNQPPGRILRNNNQDRTVPLQSDAATQAEMARQQQLNREFQARSEQQAGGQRGQQGQTAQQNPQGPNPGAAQEIAREQEIVRQQQADRGNEAVRQAELQQRAENIQNEQIRQSQTVQAQQREVERQVNQQENAARQEVQRAATQQQEIQQRGQQQFQQRSAPVQSMPAGAAPSAGGFPGQFGR